jgi:predicted O-methyltransferase YrrM
VATQLEDLPQGWFNQGALMLELIETHRPSVVVELGSWLGQSAIAMARSVRRWGGMVTCVDTWAGELNDDGGSLGGRPPLMLLSCARAIVEAGVGASVRLIPSMTVDAAKAWNTPIDCLYIDADHGHDGVLADLEAWVPHVRPGGLIAGDDYEHRLYPGVKSAWDLFEQRHGLTLTRSEPESQGIRLIYGTV